jgi:signal transduction histidine kinase
VLCTKVPLRDTRGEIVGVVGINRDITDQHLASQALEFERRQLLSIFDSIDEVVYVADPGTYELLYANEAFKRHWGAVEGRKCHLVLQGLEAPCTFCTNAYLFGDHTGQSYIWEFQNRVNQHWYRCIDKAIRWPDGRLVRCEVAIDITARKQMEHELRHHQDKLRSLASELVLTGERERRRLATEVHDHVGQVLAVAKIKLGSLGEPSARPELGALLEDVRILLEQAIQYTRTLTFDLSPPILYELGLEAALQWLVEQAQKQHGLAAQFEDDGQRKPLENDIRVLLFQAARELLVNVAKHAHARRVRLSVWRSPGRINIVLEDDGVGFESQRDRPGEARSAGFGLFNIRERLDHLGGRITMESQPGQGTRVTLQAPLKRTKRPARRTTS